LSGADRELFPQVRECGGAAGGDKW